MPATALAKMVAEHKDEAIRLRALWALHVMGGIPDAEVAGARQERQRTTCGPGRSRLVLENKPETRVTDSVFTDSGRPTESPWFGANSRRCLHPPGRCITGEGEADDRRRTDRPTARTRPTTTCPYLYWYALEPLVADDPAKGLKLAARWQDPATAPVRGAARRGDRDAGSALALAREGVRRSRRPTSSGSRICAGFKKPLKGKRQRADAGGLGRRRSRC